MYLFLIKPLQINAINAATEAACLILSVDETVKNPKVILFFHSSELLIVLSFCKSKYISTNLLMTIITIIVHIRLIKFLKQTSFLSLVRGIYS